MNDLQRLDDEDTDRYFEEILRLYSEPPPPLSAERVRLAPPPPPQPIVYTAVPLAIGALVVVACVVAACLSN